MLAANGASCPDGFSSVDNEYACRAAADHFGFAGWDWGGTETESSWPAGCYGCSSCGGFWFNFHSSGNNINSANSICAADGFNVFGGEILFLGDSDLDLWSATTSTYFDTFPDSATLAVGGYTCGTAGIEQFSLDSTLILILTANPLPLIPNPFPTTYNHPCH